MYSNFQYSVNLLNENVFDFDWKDNHGKTRHTQLTLRELINEYVTLKKRLDKRNLMLQMINQYRAQYKKELERKNKIDEIFNENEINNMKKYKHLQCSINRWYESVFDFDWEDNHGKTRHTQLTLGELINEYVTLNNMLDKDKIYF